MGIIRILAIFIIIYYAIKLLARIFFPIVAKKMFEKAEEHFKQQQNQYNQQNQNTKPTFTTSDKPKEKKKVGEYIDYEELE
jgi:sortase (surface protein transpeptidase)